MEKTIEEIQKELTNLFYQEGQKHLKEGRPITYAEGTNIIKEYPDGEKEVIGTAPAWVPVKEKTIILKK